MNEGLMQRAIEQTAEDTKQRVMARINADSADHINQPIIITGVPRSRTSMVASIFDHCGAWGGEYVQPNTGNPHGYFENRVIREDIIKPHLRWMGADKLGQDPLPRRQMVDPDFRLKVTAEIEKQGYEAGPWFTKDCKHILCWATWAVAFPEAKWVWVDRDTNDLVDSLMRAHFMRARDSAARWRGWIGQYQRYMLEACMNVHIIEADSDYLPSIREAVEWCGLEWSESAESLIQS